LTQKGTPFLYQGEEIGMTNYHFTDFDQFDDVEVRGMYPQVTASGVSPQEYLDHLNQTGRDHCRTPMQWSDEPNAGFTEGEASWFRINPNYTEINVKANQQASNSVLTFYQQLIGYRKNNLDLIYGDYHDIDPEHPQIFAFTRTTDKATHLVVLNMSDDEISYKLDPQLEGFEPILGTDAEPPKVLTPETIQLSGWEGRLYVKQH
jgi:oligo-1,6-glucosidase